jgi:hypothetical protein
LRAWEDPASRGLEQFDKVAGSIFRQDFLPPAPCTISLRNRHPSALSRSTSWTRSATSIWKRFQPPGSGETPSSIETNRRIDVGDDVAN